MAEQASVLPKSPRLPRRVRERRILSVARDILLEDGLTGFTIERIADAIGYTRAAIYRHYFPCKEEILIALAIESTELRARLYERAALFKARPRERVVAHGEVYAILYPRHLDIEFMVHANSVRGKTSPERQSELKLWENRCLAMGAGIVRDAVAQGDLVLPDGLSAEGCALGLWSGASGTLGIMNTDRPLRQMGIEDPLVAVRLIGRCTLDGLGWRPLSTEWDYRETMQRIYAEVFPPQVIREMVGTG